MAYELDFLPVGEGEHSGDAMLFRFTYPNPANNGQVVVVVDGGYQATGSELVSHIYKYYGTDRVDIVVSTHPDADHVNGLEVVLEQMRVGELLMHLPWAHAQDLQKSLGDPLDKSMSAHLRKSLEGGRNLEAMAKKRGVPIVEPFAGLERFGGALTVVGPTETYYESLLQEFRHVSALKAAGAFVKRLLRGAATRVMEALDIETLNDEGETTAENNSSTVIQLLLDGDRLLLTGDAGMPALNNAADYMDVLGTTQLPLSFMQVPHHGSRHNVGPTVLNRLLGPPISAGASRSAIVSVSPQAPDMPSKQVTNAFRRRGAPVIPTQGRVICHYHGTPARAGWVPATPLPLYDEVESSN